MSKFQQGTAVKIVKHHELKGRFGKVDIFSQGHMRIHVVDWNGQFSYVWVNNDQVLLANQAAVDGLFRQDYSKPIDFEYEDANRDEIEAALNQIDNLVERIRTLIS